MVNEARPKQHICPAKRCKDLAPLRPGWSESAIRLRRCYAGTGPPTAAGHHPGTVRPCSLRWVGPPGLLGTRRPKRHSRRALRVTQAAEPLSQVQPSRLCVFALIDSSRMRSKPITDQRSVPRARPPYTPGFPLGRNVLSC